MDWQEKHTPSSRTFQPWMSWCISKHGKFLVRQRSEKGNLWDLLHRRPSTWPCRTFFTSKTSPAMDPFDFSMTLPTTCIMYMFPRNSALGPPQLCSIGTSHIGSSIFVLDDGNHARNSSIDVAFRIERVSNSSVACGVFYRVCTTLSW